MSKHAQPETPLERADRLIWELATPEWFSGPPRHHATDRRWDVRKALIDEFHAFPQRFLCGVITDRKDLWERNLAAIRWEIDNKEHRNIFAKNHQYLAHQRQEPKK